MRRSHRGFGWLLLIVLFGGLGCAGGYNWRNDFQASETEAREQKKHLFIFYKWWLDEASNRMFGGEVLSDPEVAALFQDTVNVLIDKDFGSEYVA